MRRAALGQYALVAGVGIAFLVAWQVAVRGLGIPNYIIPAPTDVVVAFSRGLQRGLYGPNLLATLEAMIAGYFIGAGAGILLGALVAEFKLVERLVYPYVVSLQSLPKIALAPLFVMWFGYGVLSKIVMVSLICFFPLMVNTMTGLLAADRDRLDMVRTMTGTRWQLFWHVKLPSAAGHIFSGLQVAVGVRHQVGPGLAEHHLQVRGLEAHVGEAVDDVGRARHTVPRPEHGLGAMPGAVLEEDGDLALQDEEDLLHLVGVRGVALAGRDEHHRQREVLGRDDRGVGLAGGAGADEAVLGAPEALHARVGEGVPVGAPIGEAGHVAGEQLLQGLRGLGHGGLPPGASV